MTRIAALVALLALPALARSEVRNQGMVKSHLWTSTAGLENARTALRALTALANDATAWDATHARDLLHEAQSGVDFARTHERHLKQFATQDAAQDLARLDSDLNGARVLLGKLQGPIARGVGPDKADTRADNTMLGGAAADRGLPPGKGGDVTYDSGRGQRGGTRGVQRLRDDIKAAWDRLDDARKDLDKLAGDYDTTTKLPEP
ncbi:MAG: hypothetical protein ABR567_06640 [Myxococcales bacterium]|nr:hypothetical protein [Myxococcales bacterium]